MIIQAGIPLPQASPEPIVVDLDEIIKIAADLFRRPRKRLHGKTAPYGKAFRQKRTLHIARELQLLIDALLFAQIRIGGKDILRQNNLRRDEFELR